MYSSLALPFAAGTAHVALARYKKVEVLIHSLEQARLGEKDFHFFAVLVVRAKKEPSPRLLCPQKQFFRCTARGSNPGHPD